MAKEVIKSKIVRVGDDPSSGEITGWEFDGGNREGTTGISVDMAGVSRIGGYTVEELLEIYRTGGNDEI